LPPAEPQTYSVGAISIGPGSTWGVMGIIIVAPGGQAAGGGPILHLSPRLNHPPHICRHLLHPAALVATSVSTVSKSTFFIMVLLLYGHRPLSGT
jgi:hypothetical protein